jgi:inhibitor of KinA sporulation pathway (predicted exonuclease)
MTTMLRELDITLEGVHHQGKDDANNIAKVAARMIADGCTFFITGRESDMWPHRGSTPSSTTTMTTADVSDDDDQPPESDNS